MSKFCRLNFWKSAKSSNMCEELKTFVRVSNQCKINRDNLPKFSIELLNKRGICLNELENLSINFCSVPWHFNDYKDLDNLDISSLYVANYLALKGYQVILHLAGYNLNRNDLITILDCVKNDIGLRNILALQGDKHWMLDRDDGRNEVDFPRAIDLVTFIKSYYGDYFAIGVAAYPDTHPQSKDVDEDIRFLKEKVRAGADYIITQASLNNENLMRFLQKCKEQIEINVPIFLGFFIYDTFDDIIKKCNICKVNIPNDIYKLQGKSNRDIVNFAIDSCNNILIEIEKDEKRYNVGGIHVFTFNRFNLLKEFIGKLRN